MAGLPLTLTLIRSHRTRLFIGAAGLLMYLLAGWVRNVPGLVESVYARGIGPVLVKALSVFTGWLPFSLAEWLYPLYGGWLGYAAWNGIARYRAGKWNLPQLTVAGMTRLVRDGGVIVMAFYVLWGFNYARQPVEQILGWEPWTDVELAEADSLGRELVAAGNELYMALHGTDDAGEPTTLPYGRREMSRLLDRGWETAAEHLPLPHTVTWNYGTVKFLMSAPIFARLGISGIYFPFTGEANVRGSLPAIALPQSMAHEQAHQRGIGVEAEASFLGYVVAMATDDPYARYAATLFAQRRILNGIFRISPEHYRALNEARSAGVRRDLDDLAAHYRRFEGVGTRVGSAVNDRFLRANRVEGGVMNYGLAGRLLVQYARENGGTLQPSLAPAPRTP